MSSNPNSIVKEGFVQRYKTGLLSNKWKNAYLLLYPDSTLAIYNERGDSRPAESILLRNVVPYTCVGFMCDRMPVRRPPLPQGTAVQRLVGIGMNPQASKVHWLVFASEQVLEEWMNAILSTLPKPTNPPPSVPFPQHQPMPAAAGATGFVPPSKYPEAPPPYGLAPQQYMQGTQPPYGAQTQYPQQQQPQQQPFYPQQPPQTVIIDRSGASGYGRPSAGVGSTFGTGLAAGAGGALLGSLLGYGIGSMFAPHGGWGGSYGGGWGSGWGGGGGPGFGGGYVQDNDTYITNNYYNINNDDNNTTPAVNDYSTSNDYSHPAVNDYNTNNPDGTYGYDGGGSNWDSGGDWGGGGGDGGGGFDSGGFDSGGGGGDW